MALNTWISRNLILLPVAALKGENIARYLEEYRASQWLTSPELQALQKNALTNLLNHAVMYSRFHAARLPSKWQEGASVGDALSAIPYMTKADVATKLDQIVASRGFFHTLKTTGGSTGQAVTLLKNPAALARERAATYRAYEWAGVEVGAPQARFWGVPHLARRRLYYRLVDFVANRRRFSAFDYREADLQQYFDDLVKFRPAYLYGYVSMLLEFARFVKATNKKLPSSVRSVITTSEVLSSSARMELQSAFGVRVFNEYGCGEVGSIAHECEQGSLHIMAENLIVELVDDMGRPAESGEIVVTDLYNYATPLIRYRLGDYATYKEGGCPCGRGLPMLDGVHGRAYDMIRTADGRVFHPEALIYLFEMMKEEGLPVAQFQVEQVSIERLMIRLVPRQELNARVYERIETLIRKHISPKFEFEFVTVAAIPREKSGKLRLVKSRVQQV